eukprot:1175578-Prorocentrum_minimum.AAC.1
MIDAITMSLFRCYGFFSRGGLRIFVDTDCVSSEQAVAVRECFVSSKMRVNHSIFTHLSTFVIRSCAAAVRGGCGGAARTESLRGGRGVAGVERGGPLRVPQGAGAASERKERRDRPRDYERDAAGHPQRAGANVCRRRLLAHRRLGVFLGGDGQLPDRSGGGALSR